MQSAPKKYICFNADICRVSSFLEQTRDGDVSAARINNVVNLSHSPYKNFCFNLFALSRCRESAHCVWVLLMSYLRFVRVALFVKYWVLLPTTTTTTTLNRLLFVALCACAVWIAPANCVLLHLEETFVLTNDVYKKFATCVDWYIVLLYELCNKARREFRKNKY